MTRVAAAWKSSGVRSTVYQPLAYAVVIPKHARHQVLHLERIAAQDMVRHRLGEVADKRVGVIEHAYLADADQAIVGVDLDIGQVAPGGAQDVGLDVADPHVS